MVERPTLRAEMSYPHPLSDSLPDDLFNPSLTTVTVSFEILTEMAPGVMADLIQKVNDIQTQPGRSFGD